MKECKIETSSLLQLIDEYAFCRTMAQVFIALDCKTDDHYEERRDKALKEILEVIINLEERGAFDGSVR